VDSLGHVIGVDMTPEMIDAARRRAAREGAANVEFLLGDIEALPLEDACVDAAVSNCVINLAPDKARVFAELYRVLKPGGRFSIADMVTCGNVPAVVRSDPRLWSCCVGGAMPRRDYLKLIRAVGFRDVQVNDTLSYTAPGGAGYRLMSITVAAVKPG
jgi:arsenite methyltransferase